MPHHPSSVQVSLLAIPETMVSTLSGIYDVLSMFRDVVPGKTPFAVKIVASVATPVDTASGLPLHPHRTISQVERTDIVILPSLKVAATGWRAGRYPELVEWLRAMHAGGATLCSACSGVLLLAETGLLDGEPATIHWAYARTFRENYPTVKLRPEKVLVAAGADHRLVMAGASASWHDLVLYLVARQAGPAAAQALSKFFLLQWHVDGQAPYAVFQEPDDHDDAVVRSAQAWLREHFAVSNPVEKMVAQSGLASRSFKRRFRKATAHTPIAYVQQLRVEAAKQWLETTNVAVDDIGDKVGYQDPAFFRRLFKRVTGISPAQYRRKLHVPDFA